MTTEDERVREEPRRYLEAGQTLSGLSTSLWPVPGWQASPPGQGSGANITSQQRPGGPLNAWTAPRIDRERLQRSERLGDFEAAELDQISAWPVLPLLGAEFDVEQIEDIAAGIRSLLATKLPGLDWWVPAHWDGPFEKYGFVHSSMPAPPNQATGEPMAIEIFGEAEAAPKPNSDEFFDRLSAWRRNPATRDEPFVAVQLPTRVRIRVATYANVLYPGVGVPLYM